MDGGLAETIAAVITPIKARLDGLDIIELLRNPYFIIGSVIFCGVAVMRRSLNAVVIFATVIGLALLFHYTLPERQTWQLESRGLILFAGGGILICAAVIYFFFIRSE